MELVDGPTPADRLQHGPLPLAEALANAKQIAEALEAAYAHGIVHRDLKPANIKVPDEGALKVLDFGLAKAMESGAGLRSPGSGNTLANSPTITSPAAMTSHGIILGTAACMAPEQARGRPVDHRADIWAFGCVLYEMLAGRRAFDGEEITDVLARVIERDPDWTLLPAGTPSTVRRLLVRTLQKDRNKRLQHIGDARLEIEEVLTGAADVAAPVTAIAARPWWVVPLALAGAAALGAAITVAVGRGGPSPAEPLQRPVQFDIPMTSTRIAFALAADGRRLAYTRLGAAGRIDLMLRELSSASADVLDQIEPGAMLPWKDDVSLLAIESGAAGIYSVTVTVSDGALSDSETFTWTVNNSNRAPALSNPGTQTNDEGDTIALALSASDPDGDPLTFSATGLPADLSLDAATGAVTGTLGDTAAGTYTVVATVSDGSLSDTETFIWTVTDSSGENRPPVCSAVASPGQIWPPNHKQRVIVSLLGVTDPDGDAVAVRVTGILQDEPTNTLGDGETWIDGGGLGTPQAWVRAERTGTARMSGNGRVYEILYSASDGRGGTCSAAVVVGVPHDQGKGPAIDDGIRYNSTVAGGSRVR